MAAGLGFKDFTTGEVLTAADVDGYLMQGIWVFASTAARDAAVTAPAEGNFAFTKDTNSLWYYDGAAWVASGATGDIEGVTAGVGISGGGTSGTVTVTNSMATAITTAGDTLYGTGSGTFSRLGIGTAGQVLQVNSGATAPEWAAPAGSSGPAFSAFRATSTQSFSANTWTKVELNAEDFDTDACFDPTTNYRFTPNKAGKYQFNNVLNINASTSNRLLIALYKNGAAEMRIFDDNVNSGAVEGGSALIDMNGTTDYIELYVQSAATSPTITTRSGGSGTTLSGVWIRS